MHEQINEISINRLQVIRGMLVVTFICEEANITKDVLLMLLFTLLCNEQPLPEAYRDHALTNSRNDKGMRECHVEPDWLLIYKVFQ